MVRSDRMTKHEATRLVNRRLKMLQYATEVQNVARACRHFGVSRPCFYKWQQRYEEHGEAGLCDRPTRPHRSPRSTPADVVSKVLYLRQNYHFGPGKISHYLKRHHEVAVATSTVHRILQRHGLERIPGTRKRMYQYTAIDDCTRIRVLKVYDANNQETAVRFIDEVIRRLPFRILVVQTDNGAEFQTKFHAHLEELDIRHVYIRPRSPHLNGKVERSHRVDDQEFYQLLDKDGISDNIVLFNDKVREWEDYYNFHRPHSALNGQTPYERLLAKANPKRPRGKR